jgi:hypothetical protein
MMSDSSDLPRGIEDAMPIIGAPFMATTGPYRPLRLDLAIEF